jgi:hypothetical protein
VSGARLTSVPPNSVCSNGLSPFTAGGSQAQLRFAATCCQNAHTGWVIRETQSSCNGRNGDLPSNAVLCRPPVGGVESGSGFATTADQSKVRDE